MPATTTSPFNETTVATLLAQLTEGVVLTDGAGRFTYMNDVAARAMEALSPRQAGQDAVQTTPVGREAQRSLLIDNAVTRALLIGDVVRDEEIACVTVEGRRRWLSVSASPVRTTTGALEAVVATFADVTARKENDAFAPIRESLARL